MISYCQMCVTTLCCTPSRLLLLTREVDFEADFDDEKTRRTVAEQSIAGKDSIKTLLFRAQR